MWDIQLFKLNHDEREIKAVSDVLASGWLSMADRTIEFEESFSALLGKEV